MRKIKFIVLLLALLVVFTACSGEAEEEQNPSCNLDSEIKPQEIYKYYNIPGYEVNTEDIAEYWISSRAIGGGTCFSSPKEMEAITSLLEELVIYDVRESQDVFEDESLGSWYSLRAVDKDGNTVFEWGFAPFSIILRDGENFENIPYKTENGGEIGDKIIEIFNEKETKLWWALNVHTYFAELIDGNLMETQLFREDEPDIPQYTTVYWDPLEGYTRTVPMRGDESTSYGLKNSEEEQVIGSARVVISPEKDVIEHMTEIDTISMFSGTASTDKF